MTFLAFAILFSSANLFSFFSSKYVPIPSQLSSQLFPIRSNDWLVLPDTSVQTLPMAVPMSPKKSLVPFTKLSHFLPTAPFNHSILSSIISIFSFTPSKPKASPTYIAPFAIIFGKNVIVSHVPVLIASPKSPNFSQTIGPILVTMPLKLSKSIFLCSHQSPKKLMTAFDDLCHVSPINPGTSFISYPLNFNAAYPAARTAAVTAAVTATPPAVTPVSMPIAKVLAPCPAI